MAQKLLDYIVKQGILPDHIKEICTGFGSAFILPLISSKIREKKDREEELLHEILPLLGLTQCELTHSQIREILSLTISLNL